MKRLFCAVLFLTLLCTLAAPAGAESFPQEITWTDYARAEWVEDAYSSGYYQVWDGQGHTGAVYLSGTVWLPCVYEDLLVRGSSAWAKQDGKWGYLEEDYETGQLRQVLPFEYDASGLFPSWVSYAGRNMNMIAACKDGKWGYVDEDNNVVLPFVYDAVGEYEDDWISQSTWSIVKKDGKWGLIDPGGYNYAPFIYEELAVVPRHQNRAFMAKLDGKWGVIDLRGNELFSFAYDTMSAADTIDLILVSQNGKYGFISRGTGWEYTAYPCVYDQMVLQSYSNYAAVERNGKWGAVALGYGAEVPCELETQPVFGENMTPAKQADGWRFLKIVNQPDGTLGWEAALPGVYEDAGSFVGGFARVRMDGKWGLIDPLGTLVLPCKYDAVQPVATEYGTYIIVEQNGQTWGLDYQMEAVTAKAAQTLDPAGPARNYWKAEVNGAYGLYYGDGQTAAPFEYSHITYAPCGGGVLMVEKDGRWGFLRDPASAWRGKDLSVQWMPQYDYIEFRDGGRLAVQQGERYGLAALDGTLLASCIFTELYDDGAGGFSVYDGTHWGGLDKNGQLVKPLIYKTKALLEQGVAAVEDETSGLWGLQDNDGNQIAPCQYDGSFGFEGDRAIVRQNGKYGVIDKSGREVIPCTYSYIEGAGEGKFLLIEGDKLGFAKDDGTVFLPIQYDLVAYATSTPRGTTVTRISGGMFQGGVSAVYLPGEKDGEEKLTFINEAGETVDVPDYAEFMALGVYGGTYTGMDGEDPRMAGVVCDGSNYPEPQGDGTALYTDSLGNRLVLEGYVDEGEKAGQPEWIPFPADYETTVSRYGYTVVRTGGPYGLAKAPNQAQTVSDWARDEVERAKGLGLVPEREAGYYTYSITRLQFAELAVNLVETATGTAIEPVPADRFSDTGDLAARKAAAAGIVNGTGDGSTFSPDAFLTREQLAAMLCRAMGWTETGAADLTAYDDGAAVAHWARESVAALVERGILQGADNALSPQDYTTVEQAILLVLRASETK